MKENYALLTDRIKSAVIDSIVIIGFMYAVTEILALFNTVPNFVRIILFVFIFILYEPLLVSLFGQSIGHSFAKIRVVKDDRTKKKISFPIAIIRFICKVLLGWISLLTVSVNTKKKAIHDLVANSIVIKET
jgi:uncharacterized RDD family membrane protein YckC